MGAETPKQYLPLAGRAVIEYVLDRFLAHPRIAGITVAAATDEAFWQRYPRHSQSKPVRVVEGGKERAHSVLNALRSLHDELQDDDWVLVHDAVRPCLYAEDINRLMQVLEYDPVGGILATPLTDTVKRVDSSHFISDTPDRQNLWRAFTPQMFRYGVLNAALETALKSGWVPTDEAAAVEARHPGRVRVVEGRSDNIKITQPSDLALAAAILATHSGGVE